VIATLLRAYGGTPLGWLRTPAWILRAMAEVLPSIEARDDLRGSRTIALGTGSMKPEEAKAIARDLQRTARAIEGKRQKLDPGARKLAAAAAGIRVEGR